MAFVSTFRHLENRNTPAKNTGKRDSGSVNLVLIHTSSYPLLRLWLRSRSRSRSRLRRFCHKCELDSVEYANEHLYMKQTLYLYSWMIIVNNFYAFGLENWAFYPCFTQHRKESLGQSKVSDKNYLRLTHTLNPLPLLFEVFISPLWRRHGVCIKLLLWNRPFSNSQQPLFQSESGCEVCYEYQFSSILKLKTIYLQNFALRLS